MVRVGALPGCTSPVRDQLVIPASRPRLVNLAFLLSRQISAVKRAVKTFKALTLWRCT